MPIVTASHVCWEREAAVRENKINGLKVSGRTYLRSPETVQTFH